MSVLSEDRPRLAAVIPAAGLSSRMGDFKPLLQYGGSTVIESAAGSVLPYAGEVAVVLGKRADEIEVVLSRRFGNRISTVLNPDYGSTDMLRSVQTGLAGLGECDGFFLLPGDMPAVDGSTFEALIKAFDGKRQVIFPTFNGRRGHPPLINASLIPQILSYSGTGGLRAVLEQYEAVLVPLSDKGITADLDTKDDYTVMIKEFKKAL